MTCPKDGASMQPSPNRLLTVIKRIFCRGATNGLQLGQVTVERGIIAEKQLATALAAQRQRLIETGQSVRLGFMIIALGLASEAAVVGAINDGFNISVTFLSDNIRELTLRRRCSLAERLPAPTMPIWFKLCVGELLIYTIISRTHPPRQFHGRKES